MEILKPSLNKSNKFQSINLDDPINISINNTLYSKSTTKEIPIRFSSKERIPKERDYIGSYKIPGEYLKKRTNPTEELIKKKEEELHRKKALLELYENTGERFIEKNYTENTNINDKNQKFNLYEISDVKDYEKNKEENGEGEMAVKEDLIKVIDSQVSLLKRMSQDQIDQLSKSGELNLLKKNKKFFFQNGGNGIGLEEPDVDNQFLAINQNRTQTLKHVRTTHKPEYMSLEKFEEEKLKQEQELKDIEDEYYGRKKISEEELRQQREKEKKMRRQRELNQMIQRPGYNNDNPLEEKDILYINKFGNYLQNKKNEYNKLGYEEEWNNTRLKSLNSNGVINRTDGLPGDLDIDDYKLYYYDIGENSKLNFERPLLIHPHKGKESAYKKTFRNEPGYENTMGKMYKTPTDYNYNEDSTYYITYKNNLKNSKKLTINTYNNNFNPNYNYSRTNYEENIPEENSNNTNHIQTEINPKNNSFIKMIFNLLPKNSKGKTLKNRIALEMKLDDNTIKELGFIDENDFQTKLIKFPTKELNYMNEEEFAMFLLNKGIHPSEIKEEENPNTRNNIYIQEEYLPGMSTTTFDFLKNPSTKERLRQVNKLLNNKKSKSSSNLFMNKNRNKKNLKLDEQDYIYYKDRHKYNNTNTFNNSQRLNNSYENIPNNNNNMYKTYTNFNTSNNIPNNFVDKFNKKSDINFTVPEPFNFLKKNYHEKKLTKIQEILEERQKTENAIFNHRFKPNLYDPKMFNANGNLKNRMEKEKMHRNNRIELKKKEIEANLRPFSFYDIDEKKYKEKLAQECIPPKFIPFKANPIKWRSQVKVADGLLENELARKERNLKRAQELLAESSLPPRMEMHEKHKKLRLEEEKKIEKQKLKKEKNQRQFKHKEPPNFKKLQEKFILTLEKNKRLAKPTSPEPFTFHQPKKKAELCNFLDFENDPKAKNPKKNKTLEKIKKDMLKKPDIEPATTKGLTLLMKVRREEIENRKKREEEIIREDEQRKKKHQEFNDKVRNSEVIIKNKKWKKEMEEKNKNILASKKQERINEIKNYKNNMEIINQKINNRPLMMESVVKEKDVNAMNGVK